MPVEDRIGYLSVLAERAFDDGATLEQVESMLASEGVTAGRAATIAESRDKKLRKEARAIGWKRVVTGILMMFCSGIFFLTMAAGGIVFLWYGLFLAGMSLTWLGIKNLRTGRE